MTCPLLLVMVHGGPGAIQPWGVAPGVNHLLAREPMGASEGTVIPGLNMLASSEAFSVVFAVMSETRIIIGVQETLEFHETPLRKAVTVVLVVVVVVVLLMVVFVVDVVVVVVVVVVVELVLEVVVCVRFVEVVCDSGWDAFHVASQFVVYCAARLGSWMIIRFSLLVFSASLLQL